jgi:putative transposase
MHKVAKRIIDWCLLNQIDTIVIGSNQHWKQDVNLGRKNNQTFADIPFDKFKQIIKYQCERYGLNYILADESYTSKASFLDNDDIPNYDNNNHCKYSFSGHRGQRGNCKYYISKDGTVINADLNGSANILRKAIPTAFNNGITPDFSNTLIYKHPDMKPYHCAA